MERELNMETEKTILTENEVNELVLRNRYPVVENDRFKARCIDGRYPKIENLPALAKPGSDLGDLMVLLAVNNQHALKIKRDVLGQILTHTIGGAHNFNFHTDSHYYNNSLGCGHWREAKTFPANYGLTRDDLDFIDNFCWEMQKHGDRRDVLKGSHEEGAVVIVKGENWSLAPKLITDHGVKEVFVYHQTLDDQRRRRLADNLKPCLKSSLDIETVLSQVALQQRRETMTRLAQGLPVYEVEFTTRGDFQIRRQ